MISDDACSLVGRFMYHFAQIEAQLDRAIAKLFELNNDNALAITANIDFYRKLHVVKTITLRQMAAKNQTKLNTKSVERVFNRVGKVNSDRQIIAHSTFDAAGSDGVVFRRVVVKGTIDKSAPVWTRAMFADKFARMEELQEGLARIVRDVAPYAPSLDFSDPRNSMYIAVL